MELCFFSSSTFPPRVAPPPLRTLLCRLLYVLVFGVPRCITVGVCHQAGVGQGELMHFVVCIVCLVLFLFLFFCILNDTKMMCVRELGTMIAPYSLIFLEAIPSYAGGVLQRQELEHVCGEKKCLHTKSVRRRRPASEFFRFRSHHVEKRGQASRGSGASHPPPDKSLRSSAAARKRTFPPLSASCCFNARLPFALVLSENAA